MADCQQALLGGPVSQPGLSSWRVMPVLREPCFFFPSVSTRTDQSVLARAVHGKGYLYIVIPTDTRMPADLVKCRKSLFQGEFPL